MHIATRGGVRFQDEAAKLLEAMNTLTAADEMIGKLPVTKDGAVVVPHIDNVWALVDGQPECCAIAAYGDNRGWVAHTLRWNMYRNVMVSNTYSTQAAALDAAGKGQK